AGGVEVATVGGDLGLDASERGQRGDDENQKRHQHDGHEQREAAAWPVDPVAGRARKHDGGRDGSGAGDGSASATGGDGTGEDHAAGEQGGGGGFVQGGGGDSAGNEQIVSTEIANAQCRGPGCIPKSIDAKFGDGCYALERGR